MWEKRECNIWPLFSDFAEIYFHSCLASRNPWELFFVVNFFVKGHLSVPAHNLYINSNDVHLMTKHRFGWVMQLSSRLYPLCLTSIPSLCRFLTSLEIREAPTPSPHVQWRGKSCFVLQILPGFFFFLLHTLKGHVTPRTCWDMVVLGKSPNCFFLSILVIMRGR